MKEEKGVRGEPLEVVGAKVEAHMTQMRAYVVPTSAIALQSKQPLCWVSGRSTSLWWSFVAHFCRFSSLPAHGLRYLV